MRRHISCDDIQEQLAVLIAALRGVRQLDSPQSDATAQLIDTVDGLAAFLSGDADVEHAIPGIQATLIVLCEADATINRLIARVAALFDGLRAKQYWNFPSDSETAAFVNAVAAISANPTEQKNTALSIVTNALAAVFLVDFAMVERELRVNAPLLAGEVDYLIGQTVGLSQQLAAKSNSAQTVLMN